jgi:hypothetical protein
MMSATNATVALQCVCVLLNHQVERSVANLSKQTFNLRTLLSPKAAQAKQAAAAAAAALAAAADGQDEAGSSQTRHWAFEECGFNLSQLQGVVALDEIEEIVAQVRTITQDFSALVLSFVPFCCLFVLGSSALAAAVLKAQSIRLLTIDSHKEPDSKAALAALVLLSSQVWGSKAKTDVVMQLLGLGHCRDTLVGDGGLMLRGISGGERKRLTTAEMVVGPQRVLLMDEISTGLDSATLHSVVTFFTSVSF